ncbi:MAG: nucleotidyltransferase family protein [Anaerolineaceae bacterium]|nr:nucleotidyltransferase family protein [Anaerolineae bacterium]MCB9079652.1 nucleotidyltransferase family protein [Anaerolineaceae bacterium]
MVTINSQLQTLSHCLLPFGAVLSGRKTGSLVAAPDLLTTAEEYGLAPLLYDHLREAQDQYSPSIRRGLQALYLRHRQANQVRTRVLVEILTSFQAAGIQTLVLKGAALAHMIYPEPGLRPMRDIDLLVRQADARQAQSLLADLGFDAPLPQSERLPGKHLPAATLTAEGLSISVEIHHNLFNRGFPASLEIETMRTEPLPFEIDGFTAFTLGYEEMLWHLCCHATQPVGQTLRLIWVVDVVGFAERFVAEINWPIIARRYPVVLSTLTQFHFLTPLSETLQRAARLEIGPPPKGIGRDFQGWPRYPLALQRHKSYRQLIADSFWPSEWWLGLYYGLRRRPARLWYRWVGHPLRMMGWIGQLLLERAGLRRIEY